LTREKENSPLTTISPYINKLVEICSLKNVDALITVSKHVLNHIILG